jgi:hypothetical protein
MVHRTHRPDRNRAEIIKAFEDRGWSVFNTGMVGEGFPDILVVKKIRGEWITRWVEIKAPGGSMTPKEIKRQEQYPGLIKVVRSELDVGEMDSTIF